MSYKSLCLAPMLAALLACSTACKPQEPVYATDKDLGEGAQVLLPTDMNLVYDSRLIQGKANDPDLSNLMPKSEKPSAKGVDEAEVGQDAEEAEEGIEVKEAEKADAAAGEAPRAQQPGNTAQPEIDPDISALVDRHNQLLAAKQYDDALQLYKVEHREAQALGFAVIEKALQVLDMISAQIPPAGVMKTMLEGATRYKLVATKASEDGTMIGTLTVPIPGTPPIPHVFERIGEGWVFVDQVGITVDKQPAIIEIVKGTIAKLDAILAGLEDGSVNAQAALTQFQQHMMGMHMKVQQIIQSPSAGVAPTQPRVPSEPTGGNIEDTEKPGDKDVADKEPEEDEDAVDQEEQKGEKKEGED